MASMAFRAWLGAGPVLGWCGLLAGCGTLTYYGKDSSPLSTDTEELGDDDDDDDDDDNAGDDDDDTPGDDDDDDSPPPGDDDDDDDIPPDTGTTNPGVCNYPSVGVPALSPVSAADPTYVGVDFLGIIEGNQIYDYTADGSQFSAVLRFSFYDTNVNLLCEAIFDASNAVPAVGWTTSSGAPLWAAFDVTISGGSTTCPNFSNFGNVLNWVQSQSNWGFGVGPMVDLAAPVQEYVEYLGYNWAVDWQPYVYSVYITGGPFANPGQANEISFGRSFDRDCDEILLDAAGYASVISPPTGAPLDHFVSSYSYFVYNPFY